MAKRYATTNEEKIIWLIKVLLGVGLAVVFLKFLFG
jgi:hypothetical protein